MTEVAHAAAIAVAGLKAAGHIDQPVRALLDLIEEMERKADDASADIGRLLKIENAAQDAAEYHRAGYGSSDWDADEMLRLMDILVETLP